MDRRNDTRRIHARRAENNPLNQAPIWKAGVQAALSETKSLNVREKTKTRDICCPMASGANTPAPAIAVKSALRQAACNLGPIVLLSSARSALLQPFPPDASPLKIARDAALGADYQPYLPF